jgi:ABC-2 type transport system ATP-binding protein
MAGMRKIKNWKMKNVIETKMLMRKFGDFIAVNGINLEVKEKEIFGFLGPNGAGKTTTISMLTTLIKPTSGTAMVGGYDVIKDGSRVRGTIGVVPQTFSLFPELTAEENLSYIGKLYGMSESLIRERTRMLLETVSLREHRTRISGTFSGGMKQRLSLAAGIMSEPEILFMDEPTTGLDPQSRIAIRELTKKLNRDGMTIFYTTHDMEEAEKICDRITIMDRGRIIAKGTSEEIKHLIRSDHLVEVEIEAPSREIIRQLEGLSFVTKVETSGGVINIYVKSKEGAFYRLSDFFHRRKQKVNEIRFREHSLEDVFIHLTKKDLRE